MLLGFDTKKEYMDFFRELAELYEDNEKTTLKSICDYAKREYDVDLYYQKLRRMFDKLDVEIRPASGKKYSKRRTKAIRIVVDIDDYEYVEDIDNQYEGKYMRREYTKFLLHLARGKPSDHLIVWIDETKPIIFLHDPKRLKYTVFGENLSELEAQELEEIMAQIEEVGNLDPAIAFARERGFMYWGANKG